MENRDYNTYKIVTQTTAPRGDKDLERCGGYKEVTHVLNLPKTVIIEDFLEINKDVYKGVKQIWRLVYSRY